MRRASRATLSGRDYVVMSLVMFLFATVVLLAIPGEQSWWVVSLVTAGGVAVGVIVTSAMARRRAGAGRGHGNPGRK